MGDASKTFRYFNTRKIEIVYNHLATILLLEAEQPTAYGHLEKEGDDIWLGICVLPQYKGKGFGKLMMNELIRQAKTHSVSKISLTVDKANTDAIILYQKFGFEMQIEKDAYRKYQLRLPQLQTGM